MRALDAERIEQADRVGCHVLQRDTGASTFSPFIAFCSAAGMLGTPHESKSVERPVSRLSKRMT